MYSHLMSIIWPSALERNCRFDQYSWRVFYSFFFISFHTFVYNFVVFFFLRKKNLSWHTKYFHIKHVTCYFENSVKHQSCLSFKRNTMLKVNGGKHKSFNMLTIWLKEMQIYFCFTEGIRLSLNLYKYISETFLFRILETEK